MTIIDHTFLCKWPNLRNRQGFKYLFSPLYIYTYIHTYIHTYTHTHAHTHTCTLSPNHTPKTNSFMVTKSVICDNRHGTRRTQSGRAQISSEIHLQRKLNGIPLRDLALPAHISNAPI